MGVDAINHKDGTGELNSHCAAARAALNSYGYPPGHESEICIALDVSSSMDSKNQFYSTGKIQKLIEKALGIAIELSPTESVTIFPFGRTVYEPFIVDEDGIQNVTTMVYNAISNRLSDATNYCAPITKIRNHYFGTKDTRYMPLCYDKPPVYVLFVTDGEPNLQVDEAMNQFSASEYNAMFIRFVALRGHQSDLSFHRLKMICNKTKNTFLPNKQLLILNDPNSLTIDDLFFGHRTWLEEAHEHGILTKDPGVDLDDGKPHNKREITYKQKLEREHGHQDTGISHGHVPVSYQTGNYQTSGFYDDRSSNYGGHHHGTDSVGCCTLL